MRYLLFELGFQDEATAKDFLKRLRATVEFAGDDDVVPDSPELEVPGASDTPTLVLLGDPRPVTGRPYCGGAS